MTVFDVYVNDRKLCRAGVGADGVLNAIVSWVKLIGDAARTARQFNDPLEETRLHVGGLHRDVHLKWNACELRVGDRVTIHVARAGRSDPPASRNRRNPRREREQQRRYYLQLKQQFEPASRAAAAAVDEEATSYLNVDLDLWSRVPLDPLVRAFGRRIVVLHVGEEGRRYTAHLELASATTDADRAIRTFVPLVDKLPPVARRLWTGALVREFNVGIQAGHHPHAFALNLQPATLHAVARVGARVGITVYAAAATRALVTSGSSGVSSDRPDRRTRTARGASRRAADRPSATGRRRRSP
jgi:hypothetical protein